MYEQGLTEMRQTMVEEPYETFPLWVRDEASMNNACYESKESIIGEDLR